MNGLQSHVAVMMKKWRLTPEEKRVKNNTSLMIQGPFEGEKREKVNLRIARRQWNHISKIHMPVVPYFMPTPQIPVTTFRVGDRLSLCVQIMSLSYLVFRYENTKLFYFSSYMDLGIIFPLSFGLSSRCVSYQIKSLFN